jgi:hypothetical protein
MSNVLTITRLHFKTLFATQIISCAAVLLLHILISVTVIKLADTAGPAGTGDFIALAWIPIIGLIFFSPSFKYTLSQGVSRKTYFLAASVSIALVAAVLTVLVVVFYVINLKVANVWMLYEMIYRDHGLVGLAAWEFAALLFLGILGWLIRLAYYVSNRLTKYIISIGPFVLVSLLILFNALADGAIGRAVWGFLKAVMGLSFSSPNPYIGMTSMLAAAVVLGGVVFLLLRRAQVND